MPKVHLLSEIDTLDGDERFYATDDPTGTPADGYVTADTIREYAVANVETGGGSVSAASVPITDDGGYLSSSNVEGALQEFGASLASLSNLKVHVAENIADDGTYLFGPYLGSSVGGQRGLYIIGSNHYDWESNCIVAMGTQGGDGVVGLVNHTSARVSVGGTTNPDTDGDLNFYEDAGGGLAVKNRLGQAVDLYVLKLGPFGV